MVVATQLSGTLHHVSLKICSFNLSNPSQPNVAFRIETSHLIRKAKQMSDFYTKRNTGLKCIVSHLLIT